MKIIFNENKEDLNKGGIYFIINLQNGKKYIGSTNCFIKRLRSHNLDLRKNQHGNKYLQRAYNKQNGEDFLFKINEICENTLDREQELLNEIFLNQNHNDYYYNISTIANSPPNHSGKKLTENHKRKISKSQSGENGNNFGKKHSIETIEKMKKIKLNKTQSIDTKNKISKARIGKNHNNDTKLKISVAKKGKLLSANTKEKMSLSKIGEKHHTFKGMIFAENLQTLELISAPNSQILSELINCSPSAIDIRINEKSKKYTESLIFKKWKIYKPETFNKLQH